MGYRTYLATHMLIKPGNSAKHWPVKPFERIPEKLVEEQMTKLDALKKKPRFDRCAGAWGKGLV
jgi:hypothetical protein